MRLACTSTSATWRSIYSGSDFSGLRHTKRPHTTGPPICSTSNEGHASVVDANCYVVMNRLYAQLAIHQILRVTIRPPHTVQVILISGMSCLYCGHRRLGRHPAPRDEVGSVRVDPASSRDVIAQAGTSLSKITILPRLAHASDFTVAPMDETEKMDCVGSAALG